MIDESAELERALARLDALVNWEARDRKSWDRQDLAPIEQLVDALDHPQRAFRCIHVAGSKGKGTTAAWIAAGLAAHGWRVGRYSSPHVESFCERVSINGRPADSTLLARCLDRVLDARGEESPSTWFDVVTAAAFELFREREVDWAVIEVGLGGRLDSTNVVKPELCVITNIELEHTEVLGDTRAEIALEKAGIAKAGVALVSGVSLDDEAGSVIAEHVERAGASLVAAAVDPEQSIHERNVALAGAALEALDHPGVAVVGQEWLGAQIFESESFSVPELPGRMERFDVDGTTVVLDGAHVPESLVLVLRDLGADPALEGAPVVVLGCGVDKDALGLLKAAGAVADSLVCTSKESGAPMFSAAELAEKARAADLEHETASDPRTAVQRALELANGRWVLVTGSLHLVGEVRPLLTELTRRPC